ncbi:MAG TPA: phosphoribosylaminoimidazolesuccinocarboxamide synthase, partial [bacterium]|nr:phosphoribosylaminoimidazolesuccinocarboxamide synthase [bacterium]
LRDICDNHLVESDFDKFPQTLRSFKNVLEGRSIIAKKTIKIPVECVVRGYLSGSAWKEYLLTCSVCGINLPPGLRECEKLPEPIFTPATKEELGSHDRNISFEEMSGILGKEIAEYLKKVSISLYKEASDYADGKGIIIADTKFEFGFYKDRIILIDEILTPDSSRFWEKSSFRIGLIQDSLDKQYVRNYLEGLNWNKQEPVPELPDDVVEKTRQKYWQIYNILTT